MDLIYKIASAIDAEEGEERYIQLLEEARSMIIGLCADLEHSKHLIVISNEEAYKIKNLTFEEAHTIWINGGIVIDNESLEYYSAKRWVPISDFELEE